MYSHLCRSNAREIGVLEARDERPQLGHQGRERAERAVDMEPEVLCSAQRGEGVQVVSGSGIHRPRVADDADRAPACRLVLRERVAQRVQIDRVVAGDGDAAQRIVAEAQELDGFAHRGVCFARPVHRQSLMLAQPILAHVESGARVPRNRQAHEVRHRTAGHEQAMRPGRHSQQLHQPADDLVFHDRGCVVEFGDLRVHPGREHVGEHRHRGPGPDHPAPEAGMDVAGGVGKHIALELVVDVGRRGRRTWRRTGQPPAHRSGNGAPDRALARGPEVLQHLVHHLVAEQAQLFPPAVALGVEGDLWLGHRPGAAKTS
jgi:hypothetical protein